MASIANLAVTLSANTAAFTEGMNKAGKRTRQMASSLSGVTGTVLKLGGAMAAVAGIAGIGSLYKSASESIDVVAKLSDRLGIATEQLIGLQHAANLSGVGAEEFNGTLEKMVRILGDTAAAGKGGATDALAQIGLKAEDLVALTPDQAFRKIADGIAGIENPAQRASLAVDLFGKTGQKMLNTLMGGSEALDAAQKDAEKLGMTFSRLDAAQVEMANDAMTRLQGAVTGAAQALAIQLAPFVKAATDALVEFATSGDGVRSKIGGAIEFVVMAFAKAADVLEVFKAGFYALQGAASIAFQGILKQMQWMADGLDAVLVAAGGTATGLGEMFKMQAQDMGLEAAKSFDKAGTAIEAALDGKNSQAVADWFGKIKRESEDAAKKMTEASAGAVAAPIEAVSGEATKMLDKLQEEFATLNMDDLQKLSRELRNMGATDEQIAQAVAMRTEIDAVTEAREKQKKAEDDMASAAASVFESTRTEIEKHEAELTKLSDLLNAGAIDWDTYSRAVKQANEQLTQQNTIAEAPGARVVRFSQGMPGTRVDTQSKIEKNTKDQLDIAKKQYEALKTIAANKGGTSITVVDDGAFQ